MKKSILGLTGTRIHLKYLPLQFSSGGRSNQKLELSVVGASELSAQVQKLIAGKLRADEIFIATHASDASVA